MKQDETLLLENYEFLGVEVDLRIHFTIKSDEDGVVNYKVYCLSMLRTDKVALDISNMLTPAVEAACLVEVEAAMLGYADSNNKRHLLKPESINGKLNVLQMLG